MKRILIALFGALTLTLPVLAKDFDKLGFEGGGPNWTGWTDLNQTPAQLTARYGKPTKVEPAWHGYGGTSYTFTGPNGIYVYATTDASGRFSDVIYTRGAGKGGLTTKEKNHFLVQNTRGDIRYFGQDTVEQNPWNTWNGNEEIPGVPNWYVRYDFNWTPGRSIFSHDTDDGGVQFLNERQFFFQQSIYGPAAQRAKARSEARAAKEAQKKAKVALTVKTQKP
jgi:hypothetical protein